MKVLKIKFCFSSVNVYFKKFTTAGIRFPGKCAVIFPDFSVITYWAKGIFFLLFFLLAHISFCQMWTKSIKSPFSFFFPCLGAEMSSFHSNLFVIWAATILLLAQSHIPSQCKYSGDWLLALSWGRGSKTSSQTFTPPIPLHLYHLSKLQVDAFAGQYATYNSYPEFSIQPLARVYYCPL